MERRSPERHDGEIQAIWRSRAALWSALWSAALQSGTMERPKRFGAAVPPYGAPLFMERRSPERHDGETQAIWRSGAGLESGAP